MGLPAVILPSKGTETTSSSFIAYSFSTSNSIALFFVSSFLIKPLLSRLAKCACIVAGDDTPRSAPISLIVVGIHVIPYIFLCM